MVIISILQYYKNKHNTFIFTVFFLNTLSIVQNKFEVYLLKGYHLFYYELCNCIIIKFK